MEPRIEEDRQLSIAEKDMAVLESADFEGYDLDPTTAQDPFVTYGEEVLKGESFYGNDVNFALLDLAWRVRKEDGLGEGSLRTKIEEVIEKKGKRFGFIFAYTLLNSCHAVEDDELKPADAKYQISDGLQKFAVEKMGDYLDSIESIGEDDLLKKGDIEALSRTLSRSFVNMEYWKDTAGLREKHTPVGDGYLEIDNALELLKKAVDFGSSKVEGSNFQLAVLSFKKRLVDMGVEI